MKKNLLKIKVSALYLAVCGSLACYYPFVAIYYQDRGLKYSEIGILFALSSLVSVISQPMWGIITDKYLSKKRAFFLVLLFSCISIFGFVFAHNFLYILIIVIVFMIFQSPALSINDAFCYEVIENDKSLQFGKLRLMGSIGYAVAALLVAPIIKITDINISFFIFALLGVLGIFVLKTINIKNRSINSFIDYKDIFLLIKNKKFAIFAFSAMIISSAMSSNSSYLAILIQKTNGNVSNIGMLWFIVAMSELPAFYFGNKMIKKVGVLNLYIISCCFYFIRFFMDSLCTGYQPVLILQLLQAVTYPLYTLSTLQYIVEIVPAKTRTTAITVFAAFTAGIGGFLGNLCGGIIIQNLSVFYFFKVLSFLCIASLLVVLILKRQEKICEIAN